MQKSQITPAGWHEVFYSGAGTVSQVLDDSIVLQAINREQHRAAASSQKGNALRGFRTAVLWSVVFWALLFVVVKFVL